MWVGLGVGPTKETKETPQVRRVHIRIETNKSHPREQTYNYCLHSLKVCVRKHREIYGAGRYSYISRMRTGSCLNPSWLKRHKLHFCGVKFTLALSEPSFFLPCLRSLAMRSGGQAVQVRTVSRARDCRDPSQMHIGFHKVKLDLGWCRFLGWCKQCTWRADAERCNSSEVEKHCTWHGGPLRELAACGGVHVGLLCALASLFCAHASLFCALATHPSAWAPPKRPKGRPKFAACIYG